MGERKDGFKIQDVEIVSLADISSIMTSGGYQDRIDKTEVLF